MLTACDGEIHDRMLIRGIGVDYEGGFYKISVRCENVSKDKKSYRRNLILMSVIGILISNIGFSNLVQILYPLFGILGFVQIIFLYHKRNA